MRAGYYKELDSIGKNFGAPFRFQFSNSVRIFLLGEYKNTKMNNWKPQLTEFCFPKPCRIWSLFTPLLLFNI